MKLSRLVRVGVNPQCDRQWGGGGGGGGGGGHFLFKAGAPKST